MAGRLAGRIALVTGASRGLGSAIAKRFAEEGADLILVARTVGGLEARDDEARALGRHALLVPLDLKEGALIDQLGAAIYERHKKLDVLVSCAAQLGSLRPTGHYTPELWEGTIAVNLTANFRLVRSLDPLLRAAPEGRAIFVTCRQGRDDAAFYGPYAASKAGLERLVRGYAREVRKTRLRVNLIDPGPLPTRLRAEGFPGENPTIHPEPSSLADAFVALAEDGCAKHGELVELQAGHKP